jgi:malate dehydrogenase (oxaloacetate-decarboxylating)
MASTSPGYGITIRVEGSPDSNPVALATTVITSAGATITALDVVESLLEKVVIDITCDTIDADHADQITAAISKNAELTVRKVSDRTFLLHLGGKIEIASKGSIKNSR